MKKFSGSVIAFLLALAIIAGTATAALAQQEDAGETPVIVISGMASMPLYLNGEKVWAPSGKMTAKLIFGILIPTLRVLVDCDYDSFAGRVMPFLQEYLDPVACDGSGNSVYDVKALEFPLSADNYAEYYEKDDLTNEMSVVRSFVDAIGGKNTYFFNYDWRLDPLDHAEALKAFIENVKSETGKNEVSLVACSMGGTVLMSYLEKYTAAGIKNCVLASTAFLGTSVVGELFQKKIEIDKNGLILRINQLGKKGATQKLYPVLTEALDLLGVMDFAVNFANGLMSAQTDEIFDGAVSPTFGNMPGVWALVADSYYEDAKEAMLDPAENAALIERIDSYHYNVQAEAEELFDESEALGCEMYIVSQYNRQGLPVSPDSTSNNNDFLIDTVYGSGGAVVADYRQTLPEGYVQASTACGHNHLSSDGVIDASTCLRAERTWFIKDMGHIDFPYGTDAPELLIWLSGSDADNGCDVFTSAQYPQYMLFDANAGTLTRI